MAENAQTTQPPTGGGAQGEPGNRIPLVEYKWRKKVGRYLSSLVSPHVRHIKRIRDYDLSIISLARFLASLELFIRGLSDDYHLPPPSIAVTVMAHDEFSIYRERPVAVYRLVEDNTVDYDEWMAYNRRIIYLPSQFILDELQPYVGHQKCQEPYMYCVSHFRGYDVAKEKYISWGVDIYKTKLRVRDRQFRKVERPFIAFRLWTWRYIDESYIYFPFVD